jgi:predicted phosphodiesterase
MKIIVLSNLHLSSASPFPAFKNGIRVDKNADVIVLAGDIDV